MPGNLLVEENNEIKQSHRFKNSWCKPGLREILGRHVTAREIAPRGRRKLGAMQMNSTAVVHRSEVDFTISLQAELRSTSILRQQSPEGAP